MRPQFGVESRLVWMLRRAHHGAVEGNTAAFIDAVGAPDLLRSTFERVEASGALMALTVGRRVHSTADAGALEVLIDGSGVRVSAFCPARAGDGSNGDAIGARDATP